MYTVPGCSGWPEPAEALVITLAFKHLCRVLQLNDKDPARFEGRSSRLKDEERIILAAGVAQRAQW